MIAINTERVKPVPLNPWVKGYQVAFTYPSQFAEISYELYQKILDYVPKGYVDDVLHFGDPKFEVRLAGAHLPTALEIIYNKSDNLISVFGKEHQKDKNLMLMQLNHTLRAKQFNVVKMYVEDGVTVPEWLKYDLAFELKKENLEIDGRELSSMIITAEDLKDIADFL